MHIISQEEHIENSSIYISFLETKNIYIVFKHIYLSKKLQSHWERDNNYRIMEWFDCICNYSAIFHFDTIWNLGNSTRLEERTLIYPFPHFTYFSSLSFLVLILFSLSLYTWNRVGWQEYECFVILYNFCIIKTVPIY